MPNQVVDGNTSTMRRKKAYDKLQQNASAAALKTLPADSETKNVPKNIAGMLNITSGSSLAVPQSKYGCATQKKLPVPPANMSDPLGMYIGMGGKIPRWKKGQVIKFATLAAGYPTESHAIFSAYKLNEAALQWNSLDIGVTFQWVSKLEDAAFVLAYGGDEGSVLARAFFPNSDDLSTLFVYQKAFEPTYSPYQTNIFLHELGHVLGLRHEFAAQEGGAVQFGPPNPRSIMSYTFPPNIRDSDETTVKAFYDMTVEKLEGLTIVDEIAS